MGYQLEISLEAIHDAREAADYYEGKRSGLGIVFENTLQQFFDSLLLNPEAYSYLKKPVRQGKLQTFPYVVVYEVKVNTIYILKIFNTHQDPVKKTPA